MKYDSEIVHAVLGFSYLDELGLMRDVKLYHFYRSLK